MKKLLIGIVALLLSSCVFAQNVDTMRTDSQAEIEIGRSWYDDFLRSSYRSKNDAYIRRVNRVTEQLVAALPVKLYPYIVAVIADNEPNASCLMGGYMAVHEGLLAVMPDDNELAMVLAHEIGHGARRHSANKFRKLQRDKIFQAVIAGLTNTEMNEEQLELNRLRYTRDNETDADAFAVELYMRAGFDPAKASNAMQILLRLSGGVKGDSGPLYARSHPYLVDRIAAIEQRVSVLTAAGVKSVVGDVTPDLSIERVFGKIPTLASKDCSWTLLTPGTTWEYEVTTGTTRTNYSIKAVGLATVNGSSIARMSMHVAGRNIDYQLIADGDRVWRRNKAELQASPWDTEIIFPEEKDGLSGAGKWIYKNLGIEDLETPAGKFPGCIKILATEEGGRVLQLWYAPKVGLVKRFNEKSGVTESLVRFDDH